jgi:membrane associated rhomboid family serine protease
MDGFRRFIIKTAEVMMLVIVILTTIGFAISGGASAQVAGGGQFWILGAVIGALFGFVMAAVLAAYFFLLAEIAQNTRRAP